MCFRLYTAIKIKQICDWNFYNTSVFSVTARMRVIQACFLSKYSVYLKSLSSFVTVYEANSLCSNLYYAGVCFMGLRGFSDNNFSDGKFSDTIFPTANFPTNKFFETTFADNKFSDNQHYFSIQ